jgi:hypothetical protein
MKRLYFYLFFLSICLGSCASQQSTHWVPRAELQPSTDPNIKLIQLVNGSTIIFDHNLGWYNAKKQFIEGITITGWHDTTDVAKVQQVEITDGESNGGNSLLKAIGITLLITLGLSIVAGILLLRQFSAQGGCLIFIAVLGVTTTVAAVLIFA